MFIRRKKYDELKKNRDFWKLQFDLVKEDKEHYKDLSEALEAERDKYKKQSEENYEKYRKCLGSNGGYASSVKRLKNKLSIKDKQLKEMKQNLLFGNDDPNKSIKTIKEITNKQVAKKKKIK